MLLSLKQSLSVLYMPTDEGTFPCGFIVLQS